MLLCVIGMNNIIFNMISNDYIKLKYDKIYVLKTYKNETYCNILNLIVS